MRSVGGLADTVVDADAAALADGTATGFVFREPGAGDFLATVHRACDLWRDRDAWRALQLTAMAQDFSWQHSAERYIELYQSAMS